jgi:multidrug resistance efflux pump
MEGLGLDTTLSSSTRFETPYSAEVTYRRSQDLFNRKVIAVQDFDTAADTYRENQAMVMADQANINHLDALEAFKIVRAPFNGIVTARNTDIGDYIASGSGTQLFRMQRTSPLRVYVSVPQTFAQMVKIGAEGDLTLDEFPGRKFLGHVTNTARAITNGPYLIHESNRLEQRTRRRRAFHWLSSG